MGELQEGGSTPPPPPPTSVDAAHPPTPPPAQFDASRNSFQLRMVTGDMSGDMIGIIRRKALIKDLAAVYHAECLAYCQELLELQQKRDEPFQGIKTPEDSRKETRRPPKRSKKSC